MDIKVRRKYLHPVHGTYRAVGDHNNPKRKKVVMGNPHKYIPMNHILVLDALTGRRSWIHSANTES